MTLGDSRSSPAWSPPVLTVWGKTDRKSEGERWLPLVQHLEDAAAVAGQLWDHWLSPNVRRAISAGLPDGERDGRRLVMWSAGTHDVGKASPGFAVQARFAPGFGWLIDEMAEVGLTCPPHVYGGAIKPPPHGLIGQFLMTTWLDDRHDIRGFAASKLASAIGAHHGVPPSAKELHDLRGDPWTGLADPGWKAVQDEVLDRMAHLTGAEERLGDWASAPLPAPGQVLVSAVVVVADWLASDSARFPYIGQDHDLWRLADNEERVNRAGLAPDLLGPWLPSDDSTSPGALFAQRFPAFAQDGPRPLQRAAVELAEAVDSPPLMVIEGPMGVGKTEAALLAAERLASRFGCGGVFFGLPTMATSDAMFPRLLGWTTRLGSPDPVSTYLAHGKHHLNEAFQRLVADSRVMEIGEDDEAHTAVVTQWLRGRRQGMLANLVVGTIDQSLFGALKTRHVALRHLALASKVVIIDEVHAADAFMRRYLIRVLEWLAAYGTPVILMSATLPPAVRQELVVAYARGRGMQIATVPTTTAYPLITVQTSTTEQRGVVSTGPDRPLHIELAPDELGVVAEAVEAGACVAVIRNTVARAQETYAALRDRLGRDRTLLLHSRFVATDRARMEAGLLKRLGPPGPETARPNGFVVVGTQVIEQSLDIDVDLMVTDLAPVDLILQRAGRLHRHERGAGESDRPGGYRQARLLVSGVDLHDDVPAFDEGSEHIYGTSALLRTAAVLAPHFAGAPVAIPSAIPELVARAYAPDRLAPVGWELIWDDAEREARIREQDQKARARVFRLPAPGAAPSLVGWLDGRSGDADESNAGRAQVRDSEDGLEVIVVWRDDDGSVRLLPGGGPHADRDLGVESLGPPPAELVPVLAASTVRLPGSLTGIWIVDRVIDELEYRGRDFTGWQASSWLAGQLVLCLDSELSTELAGHRVHYDAELGLLVTRIQKDQE